MASKINASNAAAGGIITTADASGVLDLQSANTTIASISSTGLAVTGSITATGTLVGNGPAFSATASSNTQTISNATWTKLTIFQTEEFDTNSNYNAASCRFTPTVAGYYQCTLSFLPPAASRAAEVQLAFYKNGSIAKSGFDQTASNTFIGTTTALIYLNGTTDYIEANAYLATGGTTIASAVYSYFQAFMVRSA